MGGSGGGFLAPAVHVLCMFQRAAVKGNGTVMRYVSGDRLPPGKLPKAFAFSVVLPLLKLLEVNKINK